MDKKENTSQNRIASETTETIEIQKNEKVIYSSSVDGSSLELMSILSKIKSSS